MRFAFALLLVGVLSVLAACSAETGHHGASSGDAAHGTDIAWFEGDADAAFAFAKQANKPLFLYWGAEWCPPCQHLKTTTFRRPEFVEKTREFIPVYLDGDDERAQILGERLGVEYYPTVLIFSPGGDEIMRMPRDVDTEQYIALLVAALAEMRPIGDVLADVLRTGPAQATPGDLSLLAFYTWDHQKEVELEAQAAYETAKTLYEGTPDSLPVEKSRFLAWLLEAAVDRSRAEEEDEAAIAIPGDELAEYRAALLRLLDERELWSSNLPFVFHGCTETVPLFHPEPAPERDMLVARWSATAMQIENDESLTLDDRLNASAARVRLARLLFGVGGDDAEQRQQRLPDGIIEHVRERVTWAAGQVTEDSELQSVMSTMAWLLEEAGLSGEAEALLKERMDDAQAPYFFMGWVANMKKDAEQADEAVVWYRKAYDQSRGRYSRFRWGSIYLRQVMALTPDARESIESDSMEILGELLTFEDAFAGGNYMRLGQLDSAFRDWNESGDHDELIDRIRSFVHAKCDDYPGTGEDSQRARCQSFLTGPAPDTEAS